MGGLAGGVEIGEGSAYTIKTPDNRGLYPGKSYQDCVGKGDQTTLVSDST